MKFGSEMKVGVAVVVAAVILFFGLRYLQDIPLFEGSYEIVAWYEQADGLLRGNPVSVAGVNVGSVRSVELHIEERMVEVRLRIDRGVRIPQGSVAYASGIPPLIPGRVHIELGPVGNPPLEHRDSIEGRRDPGILSGIADHADPVMARLDTILTETTLLMRTLNVALTDPQADFQISMRNLRQATASVDELLRAERHRISSVMQNFDLIAADLRQFTQTHTDTLALAAESLNRSMVQLEHTLETVDALTASLNVVSMRVEQGHGTLGMMVNDPSLYHQLDSLTHTLNRLVEDIQADPREYLRHVRLFSIF